MSELGPKWRHNKITIRPHTRCPWSWFWVFLGGLVLLDSVKSEAFSAEANISRFLQRFHVPQNPASHHTQPHHKPHTQRGFFLGFGPGTPLDPAHRHVSFSRQPA